MDTGDHVKLIRPDTGETREAVVSGTTLHWVYLRTGGPAEAYSARTGWQRGAHRYGRATAWRIAYVWRDGGWMGIGIRPPARWAVG